MRELRMSKDWVRGLRFLIDSKKAEVLSAVVVYEDDGTVHCRLTVLDPDDKGQTVVFVITEGMFAAMRQAAEEHDKS